MFLFDKCIDENIITGLWLRYTGMKIYKALILVLLVTFVAGVCALNIRNRHKIIKQKVCVAAETYKDGDLVFQVNKSGQGLAIQLATHSTYTHIGILFKDSGTWKVYEAVESVQVIPLSQFREHGEGSEIFVKRLKNRDSLLDNTKLALIKQYLITQLGKHYDPYFDWSDKKMYCSELAWKAYNSAGITLGTTKALGDYDLSHPVVKAKLAERYGKSIPVKEKMIAPGDIYDLAILQDVKVVN